MFKKIIKFILPFFIINIINRILKRNIAIIGNYSSWKKALENSTGYNDDKIFLKLKESFLKILDGKAQYERDTVLFYGKKINYPLIQIINQVRVKLKKKIDILDFGGSFASIYFQNKSILKNNLFYSWSVVEQKKIIKYATSKQIYKRLIGLYDNLYFYPCLINFYKYHNPDLALFSGVLQYLKQPYDVLQSLIEKKVKYILILRTPLHDKQEQIMVQIVPKSIYKSSYPIRIFNDKDFLNFFKNHNYKRVKINLKDEIISNYRHTNILFKLK
jgi:putative methyltransferase (TIGR04325 family)